LTISKYSPAAEVQLVAKECSLAAVKAYAEANNLFDDGSIYPTNLPVFSLLMQWLQKAISAREAAIAYHNELIPKIVLEL